MQVHAYIISELKKEMPSMFGRENKKKELIKDLASIYEKIQREHQISPGDFPELKRMQVCGGGSVCLPVPFHLLVLIILYLSYIL